MRLCSQLETLSCEIYLRDCCCLVEALLLNLQLGGPPDGPSRAAARCSLLQRLHIHCLMAFMPTSAVPSDHAVADVLLCLTGTFQ